MLIKIKDINAAQGPLPDNTRLISIDVCAMYPSIPAHGVSGALAASKRALLSAGNDPDLVNWLIRLLNMVLDFNVFEWDKKLYQQKFGTAIGTSCAPPTLVYTWK